MWWRRRNVPADERPGAAAEELVFVDVDQDETALNAASVGNHSSPLPSYSGSQSGFEARLSATRTFTM